VDLHRLVAGPGGDLAGEQLGHARLAPVGPAPVGEHRRPVHEEARRLELGLHVGQHPADGLEVTDRLAEGAALAGVACRLPRARPRASPVDRAPMVIRPAVEDLQGVDEAHAQLAEALGVGELDVLEDELSGVRAAHPELAVNGPLAESRGAPSRR
jgi:hypothetical protein